MEGRTNPAINPELVLAYKFPETTYQYSERDAALYALGIGACGTNAVDSDELKYVYHEDGQQSSRWWYNEEISSGGFWWEVVLPTFAALFSLSSLPKLSDIPGMESETRQELLGCMIKV
ncbi:Enoyl-CoA hydratase 2 peroxisomal [Bienertia sinuspersici]